MVEEANEFVELLKSICEVPSMHGSTPDEVYGFLIGITCALLHFETGESIQDCMKNIQNDVRQVINPIRVSRSIPLRLCDISPAHKVGTFEEFRKRAPAFVELIKARIEAVNS